MAQGQYHMNYSQEEDRIFVFFRDDADVEHAFGLTRRMFKRLWPALGNAIQEMSETAKKTSGETKKQVLDIERQGAVSEAKESGAMTTKPLPKAENRVAYLVSKVHIKTTDTGDKVVVLTDGKQVMNVTLNYDRLIVFCDALKTLVGRSDWDLQLAYPWEVRQAAEPPAAPPRPGGKLTRH